MKSIKTQLISVATVLVLGAHASTALAQAPVHMPSNNNRHAQSVGGDGAPLHTAKNNIRYTQSVGAGVTKSPSMNRKNNVLKQVMKNGK